MPGTCLPSARLPRHEANWKSGRSAGSACRRRRRRFLSGGGAAPSGVRIPEGRFKLFIFFYIPCLSCRFAIDYLFVTDASYVLLSTLLLYWRIFLTFLLSHLIFYIASILRSSSQPDMCCCLARRGTNAPF